MIRRRPKSPLFPYTTLFRSLGLERLIEGGATLIYRDGPSEAEVHTKQADFITIRSGEGEVLIGGTIVDGRSTRSEEHTSELQSRLQLVCRLLLEKKKLKLSR